MIGTKRPPAVDTGEARVRDARGHGIGAVPCERMSAVMICDEAGVGCVVCYDTVQDIDDV